MRFRQNPSLRTSVMVLALTFVLIGLAAAWFSTRHNPEMKMLPRPARPGTSAACTSPGPVVARPPADAAGTTPNEVAAPPRTVINMHPVVIYATTPPRGVFEPPPPAEAPGADLGILETNNLAGEFELVRMEYFLNGKQLDAPSEAMAATRAELHFPVRKGTNVLMARVTARGVSRLPFVYLKDMTFVREVGQVFDALANERINLEVVTYDDHNLSENMGDRLQVKLALRRQQHPSLAAVE
jgi:hypothetical protein